MGYIFYVFEFANSEKLENITYFPYIIGFSAAFLIALLYSAFKSNKRQELYQQFHILVGCSVLYCIGGGLFMLQIATPAVYISGLGHGITYISSFSYLKLRITASKRSFRLAVCHFWYLLGCALSIQLMNEYRELKEINELIGGCILASACILIILISILEVCQYCKILNYKRSLDDAINKANSGKTLVLNRKQLIASFDASHRPGYAVVQIRDNQKSPSLWLVLLKLKGTMLFSSVVMDYSVRATNLHTHMENYAFIQWITFAGCGMALLAYTFFNKNVLFYLFCACQLLGLVAAVVVYSNDNNLMDAAVPLWMYYVFMGAGYCIADIVLVEVSSIQKTEVVLSIGYLIEFLPVTIIQYCRFYAKSAVYYVEDPVLTFKAHVISFICATVVLMLLFLINMPKTQGKSLLDIRNNIFGIKLIKQLTLPADEFRSYNYPRRTEPPATTTYPFEVAPVYPRQKKSVVPTVSPTAPPRLSTISNNPYRLPPPTNPNRPNQQDGVYRNIPNSNIGVGMNRGTDFHLLNPSNVVPTAIVGGVLFGAMSTNL